MTEEKTDPQVQQFWRDYLETLPESMRASQGSPQAWGFGDSPEMADELGGLVVQGIKTATCSLYWEYEAGLEVLPEVGGLSIILDGRGAPLCLIETASLEFKPFNAVGAEFAYDEGEGDRSLDYWRRVHWEVFSKECVSLGKEPTENMSLLCEKFRVLFPEIKKSG